MKTLIMSRKKIMKTAISKKIVDRLKEVYNLKYDKELAYLFGLSPESLVQKRKSGGLLSYIVTYGINKNVNLNWLMSGEGDPYNIDKASEKKSSLAERDGLYGRTKRISTGDREFDVTAFAPEGEDPLTGDVTLGRAIELLIEIFRSGNKRLISAITANLDAFSEAVENKKENRVLFNKIKDLENRLSDLEKQRDSREGKADDSAGDDPAVANG